MTALVETFPDGLRDFNRMAGTSLRQIATFQPPADLVEEDDGVTVYIDVPGGRPEDVEVELQNDVPTVRGSRQFLYQSQEGDGSLRRAERGAGRFARRSSQPGRPRTCRRAKSLRGNDRVGRLTPRCTRLLALAT